MTYVKTETKDYCRDTETKAIINTNNSGYESYKQQRKMLSESKKSQDKIESLEEEIELMKKALRALNIQI